MGLDTRRATWVAAGAVALNITLAAAAAAGIVALPPSSSDAPDTAGPVVVVPQRTAPVAPATTIPAERPTTTVTVPPARRPPTSTTRPATTTSTTSARRPAAPAAPKDPQPVAPVAPAASAAPVAPAEVARRQPSPAEVQRAIDGFRPYIRSLLPVSPSPEQVAEAGDMVCTAFDEGQTPAQIKATGRKLAEEVRFASVREGAEDYILRTGVALYCPGHAPNLA